MPWRKAASVLPEPVGAWINTCSPDAIAGQPSSCAGVGRSNAASNQARVSGLKWASASIDSRLVKALQVAVGGDAHVLEAGVDGEGDDHRAGPELLGQPVGADHVRPGRDPREDTLLPRQPACHRERLLVSDRLDAV